MTSEPEHEKPLSDEELKALHEMAKFWMTASAIRRALWGVSLFIAGLLAAWAVIGEHIRGWWGKG